MRVTVLLIVLGAASALHCNKLQPSYEPHEIPPHTGLSGPFGTVCEVRSAGDLPTIPEPPGEAPWAVQSRFPDTFMEVLNASQPPPAALVASAARDVPCGGYTVRRAGVVMDEKVYGIHTGWASWEMACQACGKALEPSIGPGWYCQTNGSPRTATGVWLKRALRSTVDVVSIDAAATRQSIVGWGGAITDAVAAAAKLLPAELQTAWLGLYYGGTGAGYSVARVPLGGTDFSQRAYSLDDQPAGQEDLTLSRMCLQDEGGLCGQDHKIPLVQEALSRETGTKLFLSPWSPPAWMKTTGKLTGGALKGVDSNSSTYVQAWAESYIKYLEQWEAHNVSFWGLTVQNEPGADQFVSWNSMALTGPEERVLVEQLGPLIKQKYPGIKIMVHDDQIYSIESRLQHTGLLSSDLVDGVAYHWYGSVGGSYQNTSAITVGSLTIPVGGGVLVKSVYEQLIKGTGKFMLATEACNGAVTGLIQTLVDKNSESNNRGVRPGDWYRGVRYSRDVFYQLANGASGWVDWNLLLRSDGGPNWAGNNVDAAVLVGRDNSSLWLSPMYFQLAHWAKHVPQASLVLDVQQPPGGVHLAGFLRPDGRVAVLLLSDALDGWGDKPPNQAVDLVVHKAGGTVTKRVQVPSGSITTVVF